jgi:ABC-2 type transport system permease protein
LDNIEGEVVITNYVNLLDAKSFGYLPMKTNQNKHIFDAFRRYKPDIYERSVYYYDLTPTGINTQPQHKDKSLEELRDYMAMVYNLNPRLYKSPEEMKKIVDLSGEENRFVRIVRLANGREGYLRDFNDMFTIPLEREISAVLRKLSGVTPVVAFITGHGEREITRPGDLDYSNFAISKYSRSALMNQGFDVVQLNLKESLEIPEHINILVIADMRNPMSDEEMKVISDYLDRGGNLFIFADVNRQKAMNPLLSKFGVKMLDNQLVQPFGDYYPDLVLSKNTAEGAKLFDGFGHSFNKRRVSMPGCVALVPSDIQTEYTLTPILTTKEKGAWIEIDQKNVREESVVCNPAAGEKEQLYVTAYAAERKLGDRTQRVLICGDADCVSNVELTISRNGYSSANFNWIIQGFRYLTNGEFPIEIPEIPNKDITIKADVDDIPVIKFILTIFFPACMLLMGVGFWYFRRRK